MITIDPGTLAPIAQGTLKTTGQTYYIGFLDLPHIPAIKAFHDHIINTLAPPEKAFLLEKSSAFFAGHFMKGHGNAVLGIVTADGQLIAQAIVLNPTQDYPETGMTDMKGQPPPETVSVLQGVGVLPEFRGNGLMQDIVHHWLDYAKSLGRENVLAEIDVHNIASWSAFLKEGLSLVSMGQDPADGTLVYNAALTKKLSAVFNAKATPVDAFEEHKKLFGEGRKCTGYDKKSRTMIFEP